MAHLWIGIIAVAIHRSLLGQTSDSGGNKI